MPEFKCPDCFIVLDADFEVEGQNELCPRCGKEMFVVKRDMNCSLRENQEQQKAEHEARMAQKRGAAAH
jgi:Zn finger protein HypA/HybF involved in hydrogenase expression